MTVRDIVLSLVLVLLSFFLTRKRTLSDKGRIALIFLSLFAGFRYIYWRGFYTLNTEDGVSTTISVIVYLAELYGLFAVIMFYIQVFKPSNREKINLKEGEYPTVDVFITIYNEPIDILYKTVVASMAIDYPSERKKVYILDDGSRQEVRVLAQDLGCDYLSRPNNEQAKAGNLNYGLKHSKGQYVMILDCDHIPVRSFLHETMGFFEDPGVAFIQVPHFFYNPDTFQRNLRLEREIVNEQDLFFYVIQPGKDRCNASFFAGSGAVFRRLALEDIGGFQARTLTEDLHTSMVLHSKGYKSVYLNKSLVAGLAPESYRSYLKQRQRWTRGGVQVFLLDNPILKRGLSLMQRINYFGSIYYFFHGWARIIYLVAPLSYLLFAHVPLIAAWPVLLNFYLPYYIVSLVVFNAMSKGFRNPFWSDVYETVMCFFISWTAFETFLRPEKTIFQVTPKGVRFEKSQLEWSYIMPHIILAVLLITGFGVGGYRLWHGELKRDALLISGFWSVYNLMIVMAAIVLARERPQKRSSMRISMEVKCELIFGDQIIHGKTCNLSEVGLSMILNTENPVFLPPEVKVRLIHSSPRLNQPAYRLVLPPDATIRLVSESGEVTEAKGEVTRYDLLPSGQFSIGLRFVNLKEDQRQGLIRQIYCSPALWENSHRMNSTTWRSLKFLAMTSFQVFVQERVFRRLSPRVFKKLKCDLISGGEVFQGVTENLSYKGLSVRIKTDHILPKEITIQLYQKSLILRSRGEVVHFSKDKGKEMVYGIRFLDRQDAELSIFLSKK
ncbi:MAG: glycosyltransferase family 2 protein [Nitrospiria bacterium]